MGSAIIFILVHASKLYQRLIRQLGYRV